MCSNNYTFPLQFSLRVCDVCRERSTFSFIPRSRFYELYRREIAEINEDIVEIQSDITRYEENIEELERAMDYFGSPYISVSEEKYFQYPDWLRVLFDDVGLGSGDKYVLRINKQISDNEDEIKRLQRNLQEKREHLDVLIETVVRISCVQEDDWSDIIRKICNQNYELKG